MSDHPDRTAAAALSPELKGRLQEALARHQRGDGCVAERMYGEILAVAPHCFDAMHLLGVALTQRGALDEGIVRLRQAVAIDHRQPNARASLARALLESREGSAALAVCETLVRMRPQDAEAYFLQGNALQLLDDHLGALESYGRALRLDSNFPAALNNAGHSFRVLRRFDRALAALSRALELQPGYVMALNNQGLALIDVLRIPEALQSFERALAVRPDVPEILYNQGTALLAAKRFAEAAETFERVASVAPAFPGALGSLLYARRNGCDWRDYETLARRIEAAVTCGELADAPLSFMCASDSWAAQLACARIFTAARYPAPPGGTQFTQPNGNGRIRLAYLSGDFGEHAVSHLLAGVIEHHDRRRVDIVVVAWGRREESIMRGRIATAVGRFIDATELDDEAVVRLLRELKVDIAIDLMGHTNGQRTGIFARRCAPLQVNYLGFPGTSGAPYMDYVVADSVVVPPGEESAYAECVARLPNSYLPRGDAPPPADAGLARATAGLPETAFVFCAFNNPLKITPEVFDVWMSLLRDIPHAVLWLRGGSADVRENLERAAAAKGVAFSRLVFAATVPSTDEHRARHRLADLFLDTLPYNGHATACDALAAGLPVLTCRGGSFASRVGASLLNGLGMNDMVTESLTDYGRLALALAGDPARLAVVRERLAQHLSTGSFFDVELYCRHLEAAFLAMIDRHRKGLPPATLDVGGGRPPMT